MTSKQEKELSILADKSINNTLSRSEKKQYNYLLALWHNEQKIADHAQWITSQDDRGCY